VKLTPEVIAAYEERVREFAALGLVCEPLVAELLRAESINVHSVTHRVKTKPSLRRKVTEKGANYQSLDDIHDLLGLRVITYFRDDVDRVADLIRAEFTVDDANSVDKRDALDPDRFGYLSLHLVCTLGMSRAALREHRRFTGLKFEIQVRSILQHAWAEIEHDRGYTRQAAIPRHFRRQFSQLAGLLEIADQQFESLRDALATYSEDVGDDPVTARDIDQDSLLSFLASDETSRSLDKRIAKLLGKPMEEEIESWQAGHYVSILAELGMTRMDDLRSNLHSRAQFVELFAKRWIAEPDEEQDRPDYDDADVMLSPGLSVFYLWYVLAAERFSEPALLAAVKARSFDGPPARTVERILDIYSVTAAELNSR
jgi:putative GTP pyrophosphokinase